MGRMVSNRGPTFYSVIWSKVKQVTQFSQRDRAAGWGLEATYSVNHRLIGKPVVDFLLVIIEHFSLGAFVSSQCTWWTDRRTDRQMDGFTITNIVCIQCNAVITTGQILNDNVKCIMVNTISYTVSRCRTSLQLSHRGGGIAQSVLP